METVQLKPGQVVKRDLPVEEMPKVDLRPAPRSVQINYLKLL